MNASWVRLASLAGPAEVVAQHPDVLLVLPADAGEGFALVEPGQIAEPHRCPPGVGDQGLAQLLEGAGPRARGLE